MALLGTQTGTGESVTVELRVLTSGCVSSRDCGGQVDGCRSAQSVLELQFRLPEGFLPLCVRGGDTTKN